ncbi:MAG: phosphotriesterase [Bacillota bacterium]
MPHVETLLGPVAPEALGLTYVHEHLLTRPPLWRIKEDPDYVLDSVDKIVEELRLFYEAGGRTLVDCTAIDYGRNVRDFLEVAGRTPVQLIALTGFNRGDYGERWIQELTVDQMVDIMLRDLQEGMDGTPARAGLIKFGTSYNVVLPIEGRFIQAAARAQRKSGAPVITHTTRGTLGLEQVERFERAGGDPSRLALSHLDQNLDFYYLSRIARRGAYVLFDGPSKTKYGPDEARVEMLRRLVDAGFEDHLLISGDMGRRSYLKAYGGGPGFEYLLREFAPRLRDDGFSEELVRKFFVDNPRRFLTIED